ncbi:hypothetical protein ElyMa_005732400 [Elysia marginata]|uniref:Uncharacterized protein n=1 Tax=Elysia marginata TaxID=1093978 RepID=A0AAV4FJB7_9GAST|nr:hypothetical protein ElyMa_005732400 [Elysia marginata]
MRLHCHYSNNLCLLNTARSKYSNLVIAEVVAVVEVVVVVVVVVVVLVVVIDNFKYLYTRYTYSCETPMSVDHPHSRLGPGARDRLLTSGHIPLKFSKLTRGDALEKPGMIS